MLLRDLITERLLTAVQEAQRQGMIPSVDLPASGLIERPREAGHGDFATSLPLRLAKAVKKPPLEIAYAIAGAFLIEAPIGEISVAPPGFVNIRLSDKWLQAQIASIQKAGDHFGNVEVGGGKPVQIEFVSVNPTGPVHVGHARGAVLGSALAKALGAAGFDVSREYYVNDGGTQM